ncbi:MAG: hypothetical protein FWE50_00165 [Alphaproteobacteria bacterium]|nr:hypothetical protein [Alphaproteobacteria bacterium]
MKTNKEYFNRRQEHIDTIMREDANKVSIVKNSAIGLLGIAITFVGVFMGSKLTIMFFWVFGLSLIFGIFSLLSLYYSSHCAVRDAEIRYDKLEPTNPSEDTETSKYGWIDCFNQAALYFLIAGIISFALFMYFNIENQKNISYSDKEQIAINLYIEEY